MRDLAGRGAFVTGAANGIGLGIARALAAEGVSVALADVDEEALERARAGLETFGSPVHAVTLDVSDRTDFERAAEEAVRAIGPVSIVINNAGITLGHQSVLDLDEAGLDWIFGVNVRGLVNGVGTFVPRMRALGGSAHIVNTASIGGLQVHPQLRHGAYCMTKYAAVAYSEALALDLEGSGIGVSVLCPAAVQTTLNYSSERRPMRFGGPFQSTDVPKAEERFSATGAIMQPEAVGRRVVSGIHNGDFFIFTHPHTRGWIEARHQRIMQGFDQLDGYLGAQQGSKEAVTVSG